MTVHGVGTSPAIGFRVWRIEETLTGPRLVSPYRYTGWIPGVALQAACHGESNDRRKLPKAHRVSLDQSAPLPGCSCGIYAYHRPGRMVDAVTPDLIGGAVVCWGRITIHAEGIRAQFARPLALCVPETVVKVPRRSLLVQLTRAYGVPLLEESRLAVYAGEFGDRFEPDDDASAWHARVRGSVSRLFRW